MPDIRLAAYLEAVKERAEALVGSHYDEDCEDTDNPCTGHDALRLVAAIKAALATTAKWEQDAATMERAVDLNDPEIWNDHAREIQEAFSAAVLSDKGKGNA